MVLEIYSGASTNLACCPQPQEITSYFDAPFSALSNALLERIYSSSISIQATRLLLFIARFSTGYLKAEVILKESFILENTHMCRSSLYKAKSELIQLGFITISHTQTGNCVYRITPELQCLKGASSKPTAMQKAEKRWGSVTTDDGGPQLRTPMYKEKKKTSIEKHQQSAQSADLEVANDDDFLQKQTSGCLPATAQKCESPTDELEKHVAALEKNWQLQQAPLERKVQTSSAAPSTEPTSEQFAIARQLHDRGVHWRIALRLTRNHDSSLIQKALAGLKERPNIKHPAGWLVEEIRAGGYGPAAPSPETLIKQSHQLLAEKRHQERHQAEMERDQSNQKHQNFWIYFEQLPPDRQQHLVELARQRLARLSPKMAQAPIDSIPLRAMILEVAQPISVKNEAPGKG